MVRFSSQNALVSLLFSFVIIWNIVICDTKDLCNQNDQQILLHFKHGLTDPLGMLSTWSNKKNCCEWRGVHCNINGRVTNLSLSCSTNDFIIGSKVDKTHCLTGEFYTSLFEIEFLYHLDLSNNDFKAINLSPLNNSHGNGNFSNVVYLDLSNNKNLVVGDLRWLLRLSSSLEILNLDSIDLHKQTQLLEVMNMVPSLSELSMSDCRLGSASPSLKYANLTSLEYLNLSYNDLFSELPNWLFNLTGLSYLYLNENRFHGRIPKTLLNLQNLHRLSLRNNELNGTIPNWFGQHGGLKDLDLSENLFTGSIPNTLANMSSIENLSVASNNLTGSLPESLGQISSLELLDISENYLSGVVSDRNFAKLSKLQILYLGSPSFIFDFDPHWIPPFQLQTFFLEYADLKHFPWLYTQTSLISLMIHYSSFESDQNLSMFWSWATHLVFLSLIDNHMPWDMSNVLLNSEILFMDGNEFSGGLPQITSNVSVLHMSDNNLYGSLSPLLCHNMIEKSNLESLDVSNNLLSGGLTECWVNWKSLLHVNLGRNNLTGMIPHSIGTLSNLLSLNIYNTKLHGAIPVSLKNCKKLLIVDLRGNKLSGNIPNWIGKHVKALQLRSNEFSGDIPQQICQLSSLLVLDLSNNRLTGKIPHCLHNITTMIYKITSANDQFGITISARIGYVYINFVVSVPLLAKGNDLAYWKYMQVVDLSNNHLSGKIPLELSMLIALQSLNLSHNHLMGTIPEEIGNMTNLESLDFSNNTLSGEIPQSMSALSFLEVLNLSFNNLKGQIPLGTQLQGFTNLSYMGNPELCGTPLVKKCNHDEFPNGDTKRMENEEEGSDELMEWFYMGMGVGFAIGFWIVFGSLLFKRTWRHAYFNFLFDVKDQIMSRWS